MRDPLRHSRPRPEPGPHLLCDFVVVGFATNIMRGGEERETLLIERRGDYGEGERAGYRGVFE